MTMFKPVRQVTLRAMFFAVECGMRTINFVGSRILAKLSETVDETDTSQAGVSVRASLVLDRR